jgi:hypothetical protein
LSFGATEAQGNRCYGNIENWCYIHDDRVPHRPTCRMYWVSRSAVRLISRLARRSKW